VWERPKNQLLGHAVCTNTDVCAEARAPLDPRCWRCQAEVDWSAFIDLQPTLLSLALECEREGDGAQTPLRPWFYRVAGRVLAHYHWILDTLRARRADPDWVAEDDRADLALLEDLYAKLSPSEQECVEAEGWRGWPDLYDAHMEESRRF
jgi:hypothetical protein